MHKISWQVSGSVSRKLSWGCWIPEPTRIARIYMIVIAFSKVCRSSKKLGPPPNSVKTLISDSASCLVDREVTVRGPKLASRFGVS